MLVSERRTSDIGILIFSRDILKLGKKKNAENGQKKGAHFFFKKMGDPKKKKIGQKMGNEICLNQNSFKSKSNLLKILDPVYPRRSRSPSTLTLCSSHSSHQSDQSP